MTAVVKTLKRTHNTHEWWFCRFVRPETSVVRRVLWPCSYRPEHEHPSYWMHGGDLLAVASSSLAPCRLLFASLPFEKRQHMVEYSVRSAGPPAHHRRVDRSYMRAHDPSLAFGLSSCVPRSVLLKLLLVPYKGLSAFSVIW